MRAALAALLLAWGALAAPEGTEVRGGRAYRALFDAGGARVAVWRWAAAGERAGPPLLILPELGFSHLPYERLARALQARGREVLLVEWRGTGESTREPRGGGGLDALFQGDAPAALAVALQATKSERVHLLGHGAGGAGAALLATGASAAKVAGVVLVSVPAAWEVPNEALRRLAAAVRKREPPAAGTVALRPWAELPPTVPSTTATDLFELLLLHGNAFPPARRDELRAALGSAQPALVRDVWRWMEQGDLLLPPGPRGPGASLSAAWGALAQPLLVVSAPRDNLVHPEHALAVRRLAPRAARTELLLSRLEGFAEDSGHLALASDAVLKDLVPKLAAWLEEHP